MPVLYSRHNGVQEISRTYSSYITETFYLRNLPISSSSSPWKPSFCPLLLGVWLLYYSFIKIFFLNWRIVALQCVGFFCTTTGIRQNYIYIYTHTHKYPLPSEPSSLTTLISPISGIIKRLSFCDQLISLSICPPLSPILSHHNVLNG